jgi:hypothetical protein
MIVPATTLNTPWLGVIQMRVLRDVPLAQGLWAYSKRITGPTSTVDNSGKPRITVNRVTIGAATLKTGKLTIREARP